jgi:hypothetical protein
MDGGMRRSLRMPEIDTISALNMPISRREYLSMPGSFGRHPAWHRFRPGDPGMTNADTAWARGRHDR